jgi:hypothetical protein
MLSIIYRGIRDWIAFLARRSILSRTGKPPKQR